MLRGLMIGLALVLVALLVALWTPWGQRNLASLASLVEPEAVLGGPFSLVDQNGKRVTDRDFAGTPSAMFFGFTQCPDVCPTMLADMGTWLTALGPDAAKVRMVMVSVDPARDQPPVLAQYLTAFDPRIVGLTGSEAEVAAALKTFRVYAKKVDTGAGTYTMDHTSAIYLMDARGKFWSVIARGEQPDAVVAKLRKLING
jgi:protein SCO1